MSSPSTLSFPGWALSTSPLFLPQSSSSLMWTPPKPPPIFPEPRSGGFIPSQNLLMAHSIAFTIWPPPVPFHPLPYSQCSSATPHLPHLPSSITIYRSLQTQSCCFPFLVLEITHALQILAQIHRFSYMNPLSPWPSSQPLPVSWQQLPYFFS